MSLLRVAIVGRPNVGKSSLLNMLAGAKVSIVDPTPGVTRDRVAALVEVPGARPGDVKLVEMFDTGGYGVYMAEGSRFDEVGEDLTKLTPQIEGQIASAVASADLALFVIDAQAGVTAADRDLARMLREGSLGRRGPGSGGAGKARTPRIAVVANKVDDSSWESHALEASSLGFGEPLVVSAETNYRRRDFVERLHELLPEKPWHDDREDALREADPAMRVAIVGKRNSGKSTMVNALAGEDRVIVSEIAGTTRDAVDVRFERGGEVFVAIDTAGVRRKKSMGEQVEWWALDRMRRAVLRANVVLLMLDATTPISAVDKQLGAEVRDAFKPCVIVVNKWDLAEGRTGPTGRGVTTDVFREYIDKELVGLSHCPIAFTSAIRGAEAGNAWQTMALARELFEQSKMRVGTGELNRTLREFASRLPASKLGRRLKVMYATQVDVAPPTIVLVVNDPGLYTPQAERYLMNRIRESTPFEEVPVRLIVRGRRKDEDVGPDPDRAPLRRPEAATAGAEDSGECADGATVERGERAAKGSRRPMVEGISAEEFEEMDLSED